MPNLPVPRTRTVQEIEDAILAEALREREATPLGGASEPLDIEAALDASRARVPRATESDFATSEQQLRELRLAGRPRSRVARIANAAIPFANPFGQENAYPGLEELYPESGLGPGARPTKAARKALKVLGKRGVPERPEDFDEFLAGLQQVPGSQAMIEEAALEALRRSQAETAGAGAAAQLAGEGADAAALENLAASQRLQTLSEPYGDTTEYLGSLARQAGAAGDYAAAGSLAREAEIPSSLRILEAASPSLARGSAETIARTGAEATVSAAEAGAGAEIEAARLMADAQERVAAYAREANIYEADKAYEAAIRQIDSNEWLDATARDTEKQRLFVTVASQFEQVLPGFGEEIAKNIVERRPQSSALKEALEIHKDLLIRMRAGQTSTEILQALLAAVAGNEKLDDETIQSIVGGAMTSLGRSNMQTLSEEDRALLTGGGGGSPLPPDLTAALSGEEIPPSAAEVRKLSNEDFLDLVEAFRSDELGGFFKQRENRIKDYLRALGIEGFIEEMQRRQLPLSLLNRE